MAFLRFTSALVALIALGTTLVEAAEIKVIGGSAVIAALAELIPQFERSSGHKVQTDLDGAIGEMTERVRRGEAADVVIVSGMQIDSLIRDGKVLPGSRTDIAKVGIGVFVRRGAPKIDISSVDAFRRLLGSAKSIGFNDPAAGAPVSLHLIGLFERLGVAADMQSKTVVFKQRSERFEAVARGDVEIGFNQMSEIVAASGVDLLGQLPEPIQRYTLFSAGIVANAREQAAARAFVAFISSPQARSIWQSKGFDGPN